MRNIRMIQVFDVEVLFTFYSYNSIKCIQRQIVDCSLGITTFQLDLYKPILFLFRVIITAVYDISAPRWVARRNCVSVLPDRYYQISVKNSQASWYSSKNLKIEFSMTAASFQCRGFFFFVIIFEYPTDFGASTYSKLRMNYCSFMKDEAEVFWWNKPL